MKKIFSLVALVGIFALMSFGTFNIKEDKQVKIEEKVMNCDDWASTTMAIIESHEGCLDDSSYNLWYTFYYSACSGAFN